MRLTTSDDLPAFEPIRRHVNSTDATKEHEHRGAKPRNKRPWQGRVMQKRRRLDRRDN